MKFLIRRKGFAITVIVGLAVVGVGSAALTWAGSSDSQALLEDEQAWAKAALDGDADRMASYMTDDYVELGWEPASQGVPAHWAVTRKMEWVESVRTRKEIYTSVELHNLTVHLQGTLAVVTGEYSQTGTSNGKDISATGIYANTWTKRNGRWLVVHSVFP